MNENIIIVGAGDAAAMLVTEIEDSQRLKDQYLVLGFVDDNPQKKMLLNLPVLGAVKDLPLIVSNFKNSKTPVTEIIIAIPSAKQSTMLKILDFVMQTSLHYKIVPGMFEIIHGSFSLKDIRKIEPSDLLGREEIGFDEQPLLNFYLGKRVLVTGGAGSIGSEIVRQILSLQVESVWALDYNENSIYSLMQEVGSDKRFNYIIANASDSNKMKKILSSYKPDIIFHAAAHKHLPLMEAYPEEAIKNNILTTNMLANIAIQENIANFVFISTDKAVNPTSLMGASKRICERLILSLSNECHNTHFSITRFGNVLGSNGSVIPIFERQIREGSSITVTHPEMVRFFMSIREAARLVIKSCLVKNAVIFTLDMGKPVKILDLAKSMLAFYGLTESNTPIVFTGIREGEKLYEELLMDDETLIESGYSKLFTAKDTIPPLNTQERIDMISQFKIAADSSDKNEIKTIMKRYIEEYVTND